MPALRPGRTPQACRHVPQTPSSPMHPLLGCSRRAWWYSRCCCAGALGLRSARQRGAREQSEGSEAAGVVQEDRSPCPGRTRRRMWAYTCAVERNGRQAFRREGRGGQCGMGRPRRHMHGKDGTTGARRTVHRDDAAKSMQHTLCRANPPLPASESVRSAHVGAHQHGAAVADGALLTEQVATIARAAATDWPADEASRAGE